jgi:hypothetical protein
MAGIQTSNILQPGNIAMANVNRALVSQLQLLTPQSYNKYTEKYGNEDFTWWLKTFGGVEIVKNRDYFWYENRGKLMSAVETVGDVSAPVNTTITLTLASGFHYNSGTQSPLRVGETVRIASSNIEGKVLSINTGTAGAFTFTVAPLKASQGFRSAGSTSFLAGDVIKLAGGTDAGEASGSIATRVNLDQKYSNTITEFHESWSATDLGEMTDIFYSSGVSSADIAGATQAGTSYFTYKGLQKHNQEFKNNVEFKGMFGDTQDNTALNNSVGSQGIIPKILQDGETVTYSAGVLDIAKLHEITRIMAVNGCAKQNMWLMDLYQRQNFSDGIFKEFPAGAFVWGTGEKSQEAAIAYGVKSMDIDGFRLDAKLYSTFNTEKVYGVTPNNDFFRNFGVICPMGESMDSKDSSKTYKNITILQQEPPKGGTIGNGLRVWQHGGGSLNPTNGTMTDNIEMVMYQGTRVVAANQFMIVEAQ